MRSPVELILRFRRRDVLMILPLSVVAAGGATAWLAPAQVLEWLGVNLAVIGVAQWTYARLLAGPPQRMPGEKTIAVITFVTTALYSLLPMLLLAHGMHGAAVAGLAMMAAMALSATSEFVLSRVIGAGALSALYLLNVVGLALSLRWQSPVNFAVALVADSCFFAYVIGHALQRQKIEAELAESRREAEASAVAANAASAAKSEFLATMSHEIRTPLNGVIGMAQVMEVDELTPRQRERLGIVRQSGETLLTLLNDVLDLAKIEAGKLDCEWAPFELGDLLQGVGATYAPLAAHKGITLAVSVSPETSGVYRGDHARIRQILNNLLSNALKFTEHGTVKLDVSTNPKGALVLAVRDTGIGMAPDRLHRLFEKFSQLDASTTRRFGGTGLGLAISRQLAELMGGRIEASSEFHVGSAFVVTLPLERIGDSRRAAETSQNSAAPGDFDALRVLAAEDNPVNRVVLRTLLEQVGIVPTLVGNGAEAVAAWQDGAWDLILMDVQMPVMDGIEATRAIRAGERQTRRARTPIVALTANAMSHQLMEYEAAEMDGCVAKPIRAGELFAAIQDALSENPTRLEIAV